ncbi:MAG: hypothetical protein E6G62_04895 [Actinobacteria bacterium]|nr:MAG: hypothetical protein E6G62_04895 [Actinomycetota bacterium]
MQAHADADQGQAGAVVGVMLAEQVRHHERPDRKQPERHGSREARDRQDRQANRAIERRMALGRVETGEVRQQRGLDRLEQLQGCAGDQQDIEDDAGERAARGRRHRQHRRVEQRLLGEHDSRDPAGEAGAAAQRQLAARVGYGLLDALGGGSRECRLGLVSGDRRLRERRVGLVSVRVPRARGLAALLALAGERCGHDDQRDQRRRGYPDGHRRLPAGDADGDGEREADAGEGLHQHEAPVEGEILVPGEPAPGEVAGGVGERSHH